jgi:hypothetical protein
VIARRFILVAALCSSALSCTRQPPELPPPVPIDTDAVRAILEAREAEAASVRRYQGFVRIRGKGPDGGFSGRLVVVFERPHHLRVDLLGAFGSTRWSAVANDAGITVVFPGPRQFVEEDDTPDIVGRLLGIRLEPLEVMALLAGSGIPLEGAPVEAYQRGPLRVATMPGGERVTVAEDGQIESAQASHYRVSYPSPWKERRRHVPDTIRLQTDTLEATLTPEDVDVNVRVDPEAFVVEVPDGAERLRPADVDGEAVFVVTQEPR